MRYLTLLVAAVLVMSLAPRAAIAATPTPTPAVTSTATPTTMPEPAHIDLNFSVDPLVLYWEPTPGATTYHLFGSVLAVTANAADPFCTPAVVSESKRIDIDTELPATPEGFNVTFPPLDPADKWFIASIQATIIGQDEARARIATGRIAFVAETLCGGPPSPPEAVLLTEDTTINGCLIPAGFIEITTQAALDHGQRVFADAETHANRIYVRFRSGGCVHLAASADMPFPEFIASDEPLSPPSAASDPLSPPNVARDPGAGVPPLRPPDTGSGPDHGHQMIDSASMLLVATSAIVLLASGLAPRRARRRRR